jgi:phage-related tail protein
MSKTTTTQATPGITPEVSAAIKKSYEEYLELGATAQDELLKLANQQLDAYRQFSEFAMKNQKDLFEQYEKTSKSTRQLWLEGLKKLEESLPKVPGTAE